MSLDKAIKSGKEHRNPHRPGSDACKNHGSCDYCRGNRFYQTQKALEKAKQSESEQRNIE